MSTTDTYIRWMLAVPANSDERKKRVESAATFGEGYRAAIADMKKLLNEGV